MPQKEASGYTNVSANDKETNVDTNNADDEMTRSAKHDMLGFLLGIAGGILNTIGFGCVQGLKGEIPPLYSYM